MCELTILSASDALTILSTIGGFGQGYESSTLSRSIKAESKVLLVV